MARRSSKLRLLALVLVAVLPVFLKRPLYRWLFGYKIGKRVRLGLSLIDARECEIADDVSVGHLNLILGVGRLSVGEHARIGFLNVIRGGDEVEIGRWAEILRMNEINSIPDPLAVNPQAPRSSCGDRSSSPPAQNIDITARVSIGRRTILGGRNSSLWTHNRQRTRPIEIGELTYVGSEIRVAPGGVIPSRCIVGIGSGLTGGVQGGALPVARGPRP